MRVRQREKPFGMDKPPVPRGEIVILNERCKGCNFCIEYCPHQVLTVSKKYNAKGYHFPEIQNIELCVNCGFCRMICPEFAIYTYEVVKKASES
jgi:2-oxoglutarate ferredoxin oxidoreductase subunit delta